MRISILGSDGQLGRELARTSWPTTAELLCYGSRGELNIAERSAVNSVLEKSRPAIVINAAAYTAVDKAETDPDAAFASNASGPKWIAEACAMHDIPMIHISTDYVFDGTKTAPYVENDPVFPLNVYGRSKCEGESAVRSSLARHLILRTSWVYSAVGNNFVKTMLRLGRERSSLRVVADQFGAPTAAGDLAACIARLAVNIVSGTALYGTYHVCNSGETSWFGLAQAIFADMERRTGRVVAVAPITTAEYSTPARRPRNSRLDCSLLQKDFGVTLRPWRDALQCVLDELHGDRK